MKNNSQTICSLSTSIDNNRTQDDIHRVLDRRAPGNFQLRSYAMRYDKRMNLRLCQSGQFALQNLLNEIIVAQGQTTAPMRICQDKQGVAHGA